MLQPVLFAMRWLKKHDVDGFVTWCSAYLDAALQEARNWGAANAKTIKNIIRSFLPITECIGKVGKYFIYISAREKAPNGKPHIKVTTITLRTNGEELAIGIYLFASTHGLDR